jgi:hypothetical protein
MRKDLLVAVALLGALACTLAAPAGAAADAGPSAEELLQSGLADMKAKRYDAACPALRKSFTLDDRPETLFYLAQCEEAAGRITTADRTYDDYLALFDRLSDEQKREEREHEKTASARREALQRELPQVTFKFAGSPPEGLRVTRPSRTGGPPIDVALGVPLPVDPGENFVKTEATGRPAWEKRFFVNKGDRLTIEIQVAPLDKASTIRFDKPVAPVPNVLAPLDPGVSGQRVAAYVTSGIGAVGLVTGLITGGLVWSKKGVISSNCRDHICNPTGEDAAKTASALGVVSTAAFVVGGVALGTGIVLYTTEPERPKLGALPGQFTVDASAWPGGASVVTTYRW